MAATSISRPRAYAHTLYWSIIDLDWVAGTQPGGGTGGAGDASAANQLLGNVSLASIDAKTPALGQALALASTPVVLTAIQQAALTPPAAIAGFALEAGHLAAIDTSTAKIPSQGQALAAASWPVVLPVAQITTLTPPAAIAGFNLEATQLLVKAKTDNLDVALSTRLKPADTLTGVTTVAAVTAITNALPVGANVIGKVSIDQATPGTTNKVDVGTIANNVVAMNTGVRAAGVQRVTIATDDLVPSNVTQLGSVAIAMNTGVRAAGVQRVTVATDDLVPVSPPTLTKATQGATGFSTQDLKDAGRVLKTYTVSGLAGATAEALVSLTPYADIVASGAATTFPVTSGKRLRLQSMIVTWRNNTAAAGGVTIRFRMLAGTVLVASPVHFSLNASTALATIGSGASAVLTFPDGFELSGTMQFGITQIAVGAVVGLDVHILGYEY